MTDRPWRERSKSERLRLDNGLPIGRTEFERAVTLVDMTLAAAAIEDRLGRSYQLRERLSVRAFLTAMVLHGGQPGHRARLADIVRILNALSRRQLRFLGIPRWRPMGSYDVVFRFARALEDCFGGGEGEDETDELSIEWLADAMVMASVDPGALGRIGLAVDSTAVDSSAVIRRSKREVEELIAQSGGLDTTDISELLRTQTGKNLYTADPHATIGYRSATGKTRAGLFVGYDLHLVVVTRGLSATDGYSVARLGSKPPALVLQLRLVSANSPQAAAVSQGLFDLARDLDVTHVAMDGAYSKNTAFLLELRRRRIAVAFKPSKYQRGRKQVRDGVDVIDGMPYCSLMPVNLVPYGLADDDARRSELGDFVAWRHRVHQYNSDGTIRLMDPFGGGWLRCPAFEASMRYSHDVPLVHVHPDDAAHYRPGTFTVGADDLPHMQLTTPGSAAHKALYGTRNQVENVNGQLRDFTDLGPKYHPSFSITRRTLFLAALVAGHNQRELSRWSEEQRLAALKPDGAVDGDRRSRRRSDARRGWEDVDRDIGRPFGPSGPGPGPPTG